MGNKITKDSLLDAAATVLSQKPAASLNEIAQAAGVGRATLYRYFPSREALLRELTIESFERSRQITTSVLAKSKNATEILRNLIIELIPLGDRYHFLLSGPTFEDDPEIAKLYKQEEQELAELVEFLKAEGVVAADIPTAWVSAAFEGLIYAAWTAVHEGYIARRDAPDLLFNTFLKGVSA